MNWNMRLLHEPKSIARLWVEGVGAGERVAHDEFLKARLPEGGDVIKQGRPRHAENGVLFLCVKQRNITD